MVQPIADTLLALVKRESGRRLISLDPNVRLNPEPDIEVWRQRIKQLIPYADLIKVSDEDLELLYPGQDPQHIAQSWLGQRCQLVFLTRGAEGAEWIAPGAAPLFAIAQKANSVISGIWSDGRSQLRAG